VKLTQEANPFDNVILEICDEPNLNGTPVKDAGEWIDHVFDVIRATEARLPKKHLVGQQVVVPVNGPCDFSASPKNDIIITQYVNEAAGQQMGGMRALDLKYGVRKPIEINETNYYPIWYGGDKIAASRAEGWEFIVGGGAGFNHLNGLFTAKNPGGKTAENARLLGALKNLMDFMASFEFIKMSQDKKFVVRGLPSGVFCRAISEPGRQYALYLHHSTAKNEAYTAVPGRYTIDLVVNLPAGPYQADWVDPATGSVVRTERLDHTGGERMLKTPVHAVDFALRVKRSKK
jgi:hypothetical protein